MSARRNLQPLQFGDLDLQKDVSGGMGSIEAHHPEHGMVGQIFWNTDPKYKAEPVGGVTNITVHPDFQRQGIGTHLYNAAREMDPTVSMKNTRVKTAQGKKFGAAVGT